MLDERGEQMMLWGLPVYVADKVTEITLVAGRDPVQCEHTPHGDGKHCACWQLYDGSVTYPVRCCYCGASAVRVYHDA